MEGWTRWWSALVALLLLAPGPLEGQEPGPAEESTVKAVLFYSPTCPHCGEVITESLPPIMARYDDRLQIAGVNTATPGGEQLYRATIEHLAIPRERIGVPTLVVGSRVLVGSFEIPNRLPPIVDEALAGTGIDWPDVPLIRQALRAQGILASTQQAPHTAASEDSAAREMADTAHNVAAADPAEPARDPGPADTAGTVLGGSPADPAQPVSEPEVPGPAAPTAESGPDPGPDDGPDSMSTGSTHPAPGSVSPRSGGTDSLLARSITADARTDIVHHLSIADRLMLDPAGNGAAIAVLILMLAALVLVAGDVVGRIRIPAPPDWAIPALALVGMAVALYLAFVEVAGVEAVCGPVGDCNTVQQSEYARIFGIPVGLLGVVGYGILLALWGVGRLTPGSWRARARRVIWWMALAATGFSVYLTFLEPFVIGATCAWCLTSAAVATSILVAATPERLA